MDSNYLYKLRLKIKEGLEKDSTDTLILCQFLDTTDGVVKEAIFETIDPDEFAPKKNVATAIRQYVKTDEFASGSPSSVQTVQQAQTGSSSCFESAKHHDQSSDKKTCHPICTPFANVTNMDRPTVTAAKTHDFDKNKAMQDCQRHFVESIMDHPMHDMFITFLSLLPLQKDVRTTQRSCVSPRFTFFYNVLTTIFLIMYTAAESSLAAQPPLPHAWNQLFVQQPFYPSYPYASNSKRSFVAIQPKPSEDAKRQKVVQHPLLSSHQSTSNANRSTIAAVQPRTTTTSTAEIRPQEPLLRPREWFESNGINPCAGMVWPIAAPHANARKNPPK